MKVRALKLKDAHYPADHGHLVTEGTWDYDKIVAEHPTWFHEWISFDCVLADDKRNTVWCGVTAFDGDIFWAYDRKTGKFRTMNYQRVGNKYDGKFHRSLLFDRQGTIWAATAMLHDSEQYHEAPGGAIVRFDPVTEKTEIVARPLPHVYIQSILLDPKRDLLYCQSYTPEWLFTFDLKTAEVKNLGLLGASVGMGQSEQLAIDRNGTVWGSYSLIRPWANSRGPSPCRLWRYHPDTGKRELLKQGLPRLDGSAGTVKADGMYTGPDGAVYAGTGEGLLCRIDPDTAKIDVIGKPAIGTRIAAFGNYNGKLYGCTGRFANLFSYDPRSGKTETLGPVFDRDLGEQAWQIHDMTITADGTIYAGENDVATRSGYLWEISGATN